MSNTSRQLNLEGIYEAQFVPHEQGANNTWSYEYEQPVDHIMAIEHALPRPMETYQNEAGSIVSDDFAFTSRSSFPIDETSHLGDALAPSAWDALSVQDHHRNSSDCALVGDPMAYPAGLPAGELMAPAINLFGRYHAPSGPTGNERGPELYAPTGISAARASVLSNWTDPQTYAHASENDASFPVVHNNDMMSYRPSSVDNDRGLFKMNDSTFHPSRHGIYQGLVLETSSPPDLSFSRQRTPASGGMSEAFISGPPQTPVQSYSEFCFDPMHTSPPSFSPGSVNRIAPELPSFAMSHPGISIRRSSLSSSHGMSSDTPSELLERSLQPAPRDRHDSIMPCISIPSAPLLFANGPPPKPEPYGSFPSTRTPKIPGQISGIVDTWKRDQEEHDLKRRRKDPASHPCVSGPSHGQGTNSKKKRMHVCHVCGKDFNRPSALLLHSSVHTGERSNFCKVCGRSFSNLSNLRRHQKQLHVFESQMPLPANLNPYLSLVADSSNIMGPR